jgi:hypothetical protein
MEQPKKFTADVVARVKQLLEEVPAYKATELSKQQAISALSPQILALRSKGYSWVAIADMVSKHGLPVSAVALSTYLRRARRDGVEAKGQRRAKRQRSTGNDTSDVKRLPDMAPSQSLKRETAAAPASRPQHTPMARPAVSAENAPPRSVRREPETSRATFAVRPDTEDI